MWENLVIGRGIKVNPSTRAWWSSARLCAWCCLASYLPSPVRTSNTFLTHCHHPTSCLLLKIHVKCEWSIWPKFPGCYDEGKRGRKDEDEHVNPSRFSITSPGDRMIREPGAISPRLRAVINFWRFDIAMKIKIESCGQSLSRGNWKNFRCAIICNRKTFDDGAGRREHTKKRWFTVPPLPLFRQPPRGASLF